MRRLEIFPLEIAVEGIGEQHDVAGKIALAIRRIGPVGAVAVNIRAPLRQAALRARAGDLSGQLAQERRAVAHIGEPCVPAPPGRVARQKADQPVVQRKAVLGGARRLHLDLHARHVDAGRAFAPAGLAGDAEFQRLRHLVGGERIRPELAGDGKPQRVGAAAGDVALVAGDAIATGT